MAIYYLDLGEGEDEDQGEDDGVEMDKSAITAGDHLQEQPKSLISK